MFTKDEHLSEAIYHLRQAIFHINETDTVGGIDTLHGIIAILDSARRSEWKRRIKEFAKKIVG